jgi:hypothetical protein
VSDVTLILFFYPKSDECGGGIGTSTGFFVKLNGAKRPPAKPRVPQWRMINRTLAALAFAVGFDVLLCDGRYTLAVERIALTIARHF